MRSFCSRADNGRSIAVDGGIVRSEPLGFRVCHDVARDVCVLWPNEANEVVHRSCFFVRDLEEEEGRDDLPDSCEVGVGRLPGDRLEFLKQMSEFCHNLLGRHCVQKWRPCRLRGQLPPSLGSYRFIDK